MFRWIKAFFMSGFDFKSNPDYLARTTKWIPMFYLNPSSGNEDNILHKQSLLFIDLKK